MRPSLWPAVVLVAVLSSACKPEPARQSSGSPRSSTDSSSASPSLASAKPLPPPPQAGWYGKVQADSGADLYAARCQVCHGPKLEGGAGPALAGPQFFARFGGDPMARLWYGVHTEMPLTAPASLPANQSLDIVAFILRQNGFPAGPYQLIGHYDMNRIIPKTSPGGPDVAGVPLAAAPDTTVRQPRSNAPSQAELDAVFTPAGGKPMVAATAKDGYVHLLDAATGKLGNRTSVTTHKNDKAPITTAGTHFCPGPAGGMEWNGAAFSGATGLVYVNSVDWCVTVKLVPVGANTPKLSVSSFGGGIPVPDPMSEAHGWTTAIDPMSGKIRWQVKQPTPMLSAVTPTAGGVLVTGTLDGHLLALDAATGKTLYEHDTGGAMAGGVITYLAGGKQYVAAASGNTSMIAWRVTGEPTLVIFGL